MIHADRHDSLGAHLPSPAGAPASGYVVFGGLTGGEELQIGFTIRETAATASIPAGLHTKGGAELPQQDFHLTFRGGTVVDLSPRAMPHVPEPRYPTYRRDGYRAARAPMVETEHYVAPFAIDW